MRTKLALSAKKRPAARPAGGRSTQEWVNVKDIYQGFILRKDGGFAGAIRVSPVNIHLLTKNEQKAKIRLLYEVLNGLETPFQIFSVSRPVDLDAFIAKMRAMRERTPDATKSRLLGEYIRHAAATASGGNTVERQFYLLLSAAGGKNAALEQQQLAQKLYEASARLSGAGLTANVCADQELRELLFICFAPAQSAYERAPTAMFEMPMGYDEEED